ncbi:hypothetical protein BD311DRAFT_526674 [Dichomitus squalens]|uniref:Uncharacterized protein n=1 Tax=Dichomitus squalens TaxID=114155 RepID=A0A4Q9MFZ5_9APHY|nr:hypothetical protein BD311DRAFT_526674 [Dichomitus squalens]
MTLAMPMFVAAVPSTAVSPGLIPRIRETSLEDSRSGFVVKMIKKLKLAVHTCVLFAWRRVNELMAIDDGRAVSTSLVGPCDIVVCKCRCSFSRGARNIPSRRSLIRRVQREHCLRINAITGPHSVAYCLANT